MAGVFEVLHRKNGQVFLRSTNPEYTDTHNEPVNEAPFQLTDSRITSKTQEVKSRSGQQKFKFQVLNRYGLKCAVCDIRIPELLDAAHIRPKEKHGTDAPRNGLILCPLHHRALDAGLFAIEPETLMLHYKESGPGAHTLKILYTSIEHLTVKPHRRGP